MLDLKEFLNSKNVENTKIYKKLECSKEEVLILKQLCQNYVQSSQSINVFSLLTRIFKEENYEYLDGLEPLKKLIEKGYVNYFFGFLKNTQINKIQSSSLFLLQSDVCLSDYFLEFLEDKALVKNEIKESYKDFLEYLKDEFLKVELYQRFAFVKSNFYKLKIKDEINLVEKNIKDRLKISKIKNTLNEIYKENSLNKKEQLIFLALLKEEYTIDNESSNLRELNYLLSLVSDDEFEFKENKKLLDDNSKLIQNNLLEYDEYLNSFGEITKSFFISDYFLQKIIDTKPKQNKKIKLQNAIKEQDIFELIEPNTHINDVIMPKATKELLKNILKQQDKKVLERLNKWNIKTSKNIEAKIIFYGPAGTGKTMSALSMAKSMKKAVLSFDCSKILSKYVGESEQNVRKIFDTYKQIAKNCKQSPILLLNEADQFLSTRLDSSSSADKMHNQMQNIFLEQIEKFDGVIIATTNFLESLDSAFSRRFDYKIEFKKPDFEDRLKIWNKFLPKNAKFDKDFNIKILAKYELSGAQILMVIKNTALKAAICEDGIFNMKYFLDSIEKELDSSFDKSKIVGFK